PDVMVPSVAVVVDALPLGPSGKLDHARLPAVAHAGGTNEPPASPEEQRVANIFRELTGAASVGRGDDFFALGGTSLSAIRVVAQLRRMLGVELPVRALFEAPTVAALALRIGELA